MHFCLTSEYIVTEKQHLDAVFLFLKVNTQNNYKNEVNPDYLCIICLI